MDVEKKKLRDGQKQYFRFKYKIRHNELLVELVMNKLTVDPCNEKYKLIINYLKKNKELDKFMYNKFHNMTGKLSNYITDNLVKHKYMFDDK